MNDLKTVKKSVRPQKCGLVPCDDAMICWPGSFRSPDPLSSSWHQRLQVDSAKTNKASVEGGDDTFVHLNPVRAARLEWIQEP
ncbi:MAG TPA: hypothetical protein DER01_20065 [Phycisphaerales bacterium]|nr:hypothetical protein [Phycisphaerales bacterium]